MARPRIVAGNWKMHKTYDEGRDLAKDIAERLQPSDTIVILGTPYIHLKSISGIIKDIAKLHLAAQNCHQEEQGAYTGEISAPMLRSVGVEFVILGHSERRQYFHETDELIAAKVKQVLKHGMRPIFCCGEPLEVREKDGQEALVEEQVKKGLFDLSAAEVAKVVIAYEPVWAIGTGKTATPEQAQEMHAFIRKLLRDQYGEEIAADLPILYGGSVKPANAQELFAQADVDGGLVGGACLVGEDFVAIVNSFS